MVTLQGHSITGQKPSHNPPMDDDPHLGEETLLRSLRRRYAELSTWLVRLTRLPDHPGCRRSLVPLPTRDQCPSETTKSISAGVRQLTLWDADCGVSNRGHRLGHQGAARMLSLCCAENLSSGRGGNGSWCDKATSPPRTITRPGTSPALITDAGPER